MKKTIVCFGDSNTHGYSPETKGRYNDTKERFSSTSANIAKGMERLIKKAQTITDAFYNKVPNILLIAPPPIEDGYEISFVGNEMGKDCAIKSRELAFYYEKITTLTGVRFLDAGKIPGMKMHPNDYMHFTKESHDILAKTLTELIPGYTTIK